MRYTEYIRLNLSEGKITFYDESKGYSSGQSDMVLNMYVDKEEVGKLDYSIYGKEVSIKFIDVHLKFRRKGYGEKLILKLQGMFPKSEIQLGMLTGMGSKLISKVKSKLYIDKARLNKIKGLKKKLEVTKKAIQDIMRSKKGYDKLNDLHDIEYEVGEELRGLDI